MSTDPHAPIRRRFRFQGHVQGVGFRASTRSIAAGFGVTGWVRNDPDGSVEMEVQGDPAEIELFLMEHEGQLGGYVQDRADEAVDTEPGELEFEIR